jgi:hypothetical protein
MICFYQMESIIHAFAFASSIENYPDNVLLIAELCVLQKSVLSASNSVDGQLSAYTGISVTGPGSISGLSTSGGGNIGNSTSHGALSSYSDGRVSTPPLLGNNSYANRPKQTTGALPVLWPLRFFLCNSCVYVLRKNCNATTYATDIYAFVMNFRRELIPQRSGRQQVQRRRGLDAGRADRQHRGRGRGKNVAFADRRGRREYERFGPSQASYIW